MGTNYETDGEEHRSRDGSLVMVDQVAHFWGRPIGSMSPESGTDDGAPMMRMVSQLGDDSGDGSSDVQAVRRGRLAFPDGQPRRPAGRWRAAPSRRAVSIASDSSFVPSDRPHYSPSHDPSMGDTTEEDDPHDGPLGGYRAGSSIGRGRSLSSLDGYASNQSDVGTPIDRSPTTHGGSSDLHSDSDVGVRPSSTEPDRSDDDDDDRYSHDHASSSNGHSIHSAACLSPSSHSDSHDQYDSDYSSL